MTTIPLLPHQKVADPGGLPSRELVEIIQRLVDASSNDAVTYARMQNVSAASRLLGRGSAAGAGDPEEITLGTGLSMSGTTLNASEYLYGVLGSDYVLTSTTATQKLFNWSTNGALTLSTGRYLINMGLFISGMSGTSGNATFHLLGAGTATLADILQNFTGIDDNTPMVAGTTTGSGSNAQNSVASMVTATTGTGLRVHVNAGITVTGAGTIIPSIALVTAAAATVRRESYFVARRLGAGNTSGGWT